MGQSFRSVVAGCAALFLTLASAGARSQGTEMVAKAQDAVGVRMVRLSAVRGNVQLDRLTGRGFEAGFTNLPIVQGDRLRTQGLGWAEVEFEDGSTLRITPETQVDFPTLTRSANGQVQNALSLTKGTLYVSRVKGDKTDLLVVAAGKKITLPPDSHVRLDLYPSGSELMVVKGDVRVEDESGMVTTVGKGRALKFGTAAGPQLVRAKDEAPGLYDRWDAAAVEYHQALVATGGAGSLIGVRDMQYYGSFTDINGCGRVWRPYLASAGFDPAATGVWAWYPGVGYNFVSPYAWGWTAFNSGSWVSCGTQGYGWRPGAYVGLKNHGIVEPIHGVGHRPRPIGEPVAGKPTIVAAGERAMVRSSLSVDGPSKFEKDSAGLGVPRGLLTNLKGISKAVESGKTAPQPSFSGDLVAADPVALTVMAQSTLAGVRSAEVKGGRPVEMAGNNSRPVAPSIVGVSHGGGYAGGRSSFSNGASSPGGWSGSSAGGGRSGGPISTSGSSVSSSSAGSSSASSSAGGHH